MFSSQVGKPNPAFINDDGSRIDLKINVENGLSPKVCI